MYDCMREKRLPGLRRVEHRRVRCTRSIRRIPYVIGLSRHATIRCHRDVALWSVLLRGEKRKLPHEATCHSRKAASSICGGRVAHFGKLPQRPQY